MCPEESASASHYPPTLTDITRCPHLTHVADFQFQAFCLAFCHFRQIVTQAQAELSQTFCRLKNSSGDLRMWSAFGFHLGPPPPSMDHSHVTAAAFTAVLRHRARIAIFLCIFFPPFASGTMQKKKSTQDRLIRLHQMTINTVRAAGISPSWPRSRHDFPIKHPCWERESGVRAARPAVCICVLYVLRLHYGRRGRSPTECQEAARP